MLLSFLSCGFFVRQIKPTNGRDFLREVILVAAVNGSVSRIHSSRFVAGGLNLRVWDYSIPNVYHLKGKI